MGDARDPLASVLAEVRQERALQDRRWGEQNHSPAQYLAILAEEFGEAAKEAVEAEFEKPWGDPRARLREELVQTAAVAVAFIECLDRNVPERIVARRLFNAVAECATQKWAEEVSEKYPGLLSSGEYHR